MIECQQDTVATNDDRRCGSQSQFESSLLSLLQHASALKLQRITLRDYRLTQELAIEMCKEMGETETGRMSRIRAVLKLKSMELARDSRHLADWNDAGQEAEAEASYK